LILPFPTAENRRVRARRLLVAALSLAALALALASLGTAGTPAPLRLTVMTFNIEYGGTLVDFDKVVAAIRRSGADIVGVEEAETNIPRLAKALGWPYYSAGMHIVSKYPVLEPSGADGAYAFVEVEEGKVVALANVHLPSDPYGPYWVRDGKPPAKVLALERRLRLPALTRQLELLPRLAEQGIPVFLVGDFNSPSHLDWTEAAVGKRRYVKYAVEWPVSKALADAGFRDSYREAHPDPVAEPGITWWAARPKVVDWAGNPTAKDPRDRIDFVYALGPSTTIASELVGERGAAGVSLSVAPWPSDHRAVVSTFDVTPGRMPNLVAVDRWLVTSGAELTVHFHAPGEPGETGALVRAGGEPKDAVASRPTGGATSGALDFSTAGLAAGAYEALLVGGQANVVARISFWIRARGAPVTLETDKRTYRVGEPIEVTWTNAPANRWDWLGVYRAPADPDVDSYLIWQYAGGAMSGTGHGLPEGSLVLDGASTYGKPWPLPPGKYEVLYLVSDTYRDVARATFRVGN
jgi:endonuclease/exonuclease/phosphatase family metal-dependent hydrolase